MPAVIPAIVAWAGSTAFTVAGVAVTYGTLVQAAVIAGSIAYSSAENRRIQNQLSGLNADRGRDLMVRDPLAYRRLIYGQVRTTGPILYMATEGTKNENLHLVVALASHECDGLGEVTFDNDELVALDGSGNAVGKYAGFVTVKKFLGTTTQSASPELIAAFPGVWTSNHNLFGIAYLHVKIKYSIDLFPNGMPTVKCLVRGKKVWDPRVNPSDTTIRTWSCNSTLCTADFINDSIFGRGVAWTRINSAAMIEGANVCEEAIGLAGSFTRQMDVTSGSKNVNMTTQAAAQLDGIVVGMRISGTGIPAGARVTYIDDVGPVFYFSIDINATSTGTNRTGTFGATEYRYETHGTVTSDQLVDTVILDLAGSMAGHVTDMGGIWTIRAGAYRTPTVSLDESHMIGPMTMTPRTSRRDNYNGVKGVYISPFNQWVASDFPAVKNDTYMAWDGGIRLWKDVTLPFTISPSAAQRLAKIDLERGRQQISVEQTFKLHAFECMCFDTVRITKTELGWTTKEFEVTNWKFTVIMDGGAAALGVTLNLRETASAVWDWTDGSETVVDLADNTNLPDPSVVPTPSLNAPSSDSFRQSDGTFAPRVKLQVASLPNNAYLENGGKICWEYKKHADATWIVWEEVKADNLISYVTDVLIGTSYDFRVRWRNQLGANGLYSTQSSYTVTGDTTAPSNPTGLAGVTGTGKAVSLSWTANTESDLDEYNIYRNTSNTFAGATKVGTASANRFVDINVTISSTYFYFVTAVDRSGNESGASSSSGALTPGTITAGSVDSTPPSDPAAPTISSSGTRDAGDGSIISFVVLSYSGAAGTFAMPTGAIGINALYRIHGTSGWTLGNQINPGDPITVTIDLLSPNQVYDFAYLAFSFYGAVSNVVPLNSQTAPNKTTGPGTPSSGSLTAPSSGTPVPAQMLPGATFPMWATIVKFTVPADLDVCTINIKATNTNGDSATDYTWTLGSGSSALGQLACSPGQVITCVLYNNSGSPSSGWVRVQAVNSTGIVGSWLNIGQANGATAPSGGTMVGQNASAIATTGGTEANVTHTDTVMQARSITIAPTAAVSPSVTICVYEGRISKTFSGGAAYEVFDIDLTNRGFSAKPVGGHLSLVDTTGQYVAFYDSSSASSTSTNARCVVRNVAGGLIPAATGDVIFRFFA